MIYGACMHGGPKYICRYSYTAHACSPAMQLLHARVHARTKFTDFIIMCMQNITFTSQIACRKKWYRLHPYTPMIDVYTVC